MLDNNWYTKELEKEIVRIVHKTTQQIDPWDVEYPSRNRSKRRAQVAVYKRALKRDSRKILVF